MTHSTLAGRAMPALTSDGATSPRRAVARTAAQPVRPWRLALLASTLLTGAGALTALVPFHAVAQENIDGEESVTVPGDEESPWIINDVLNIGVSSSGSLTITDGGSVSDAGAFIGLNPGSTGTVIVTGEGSTWEQDFVLNVGFRGSGSLTVENGGSVSTDFGGSIGFFEASEGAVTVTGENSLWDIKGALRVGDEGSGTLKIEDGGAVRIVEGIIGNEGTSTGTVSVTGADSTLTNSAALVVGLGGDGTLAIAEGGSVSNVIGGVGIFADATGIVTVTGVDSTWTNLSELQIGDSGSGTLTIAESGAVSSNGAFIGNRSDSEGEVIVTGEGSTWTDSRQMQVGREGVGSLTIRDGGAVSNVDGIVGVLDASTGAATVTGADSTWTNSGFLFIGTGGVGTLTIQNGGEVSSAFGAIGVNSGSEGEVTVTGAASTWTNDGVLNVGESGQGTLTLSDGGSVRAIELLLARFSGAGTLNFGAAAGGTAVASGTLDTPTITFGAGDGTIVFNHTDDDFQLGADISGAGEIRLLSGRTILSGDNSYTGDTLLEGGTLTLGSNTALGMSTLTTTGSVVDYVDGVTTANSIVIDSDTTQFQVLTGSATQSGVISEANGPRQFEKIGDGELVLTADNTWTGQTNVFQGTLTFDGGSLDTSRNVFVGGNNGEDGALIIRNGAAVSNGAGLIGTGGLNASDGTVTVTGAGSTWTNSSDLIVGRNLSDGTLTIENGGVVSSAAGTIGFSPDSTGVVTVTGEGSTWENSGSLRVGSAGASTLTITEGGAVSNTDSFIAFSPANTDSSVTVSGAGSTWTNSGDLYVGEFGQGALTIADGGVVTASSVNLADPSGSDPNGDFVLEPGSGTLNFGAAAGDAAVAAGTLDTPTLAFGPGDGTIVFNHTDDDFELDADISGDGDIRLLSGRTALTGDNTYTGDTLLEGGTLTLASDTALGGSTLTTTGSVVDYLDGVNIANSVVINSDTTQFQVLAGSATQSGVISEENGPRPFEKIGAGELILTADSTWTGRTTISDGTLTFDGGSVALASGTDLIVGAEDGDDGALIIENGGAVNNAEGVIGSAVDAVGAVTVTGAGSTWTNSEMLFVGGQGNGVMIVENGGAAFNTTSFIGSQDGSTGAVTVTGESSTWTNSVNLWVGQSGEGTLTVEEGGLVTSDSGYIGVNTGSTGAVTVNGADSTWTNSDELLIGISGGDGTLTIEDGGSVTGASGSIGAGLFSRGAVTVTGAGSRLETSSSLVIGNDGVGSLVIEAGGVVSSDFISIGGLSSPNATVTVSGSDSRLNAVNFLVVGNPGGGMLSIEGGAKVSSPQSIISVDSNSFGPQNPTAVSVTGAGSSWAAGDLTLGEFGGDATLTLAQSGDVSASSVMLARAPLANATLNFGAATGDTAVAAGTLTAPTIAFGEGDGRLVFNHAAAANGAGYGFDADLSSDAAGDALIDHVAGFTRLTGASSGYQGDLAVRGGVVSVDGVLGSGDVTASVTSGGALTGSGTLAGDVAIGAGAILSGQTGSTFTIGGDLALDDGAVVNVALGAAGGSELFDAGGDLTLDGTLNIADAGGFGAGLYTLFTYDGALTDHGFALGTVSGGPYLPGEVEIQTALAGQVNFLSRAGVDLAFWDGDAPGNLANGAVDGGDGVWTATSQTFTDSNGDVNGPVRPDPAFLLFAGAPGQVTVDDGAGAVSMAGAQFAANGYAIDGDAITLTGNGDGDAILRVGDGSAAGGGFAAEIASDLGGSARLVKTDLGTLVLTGANSYSGGTFVQSGVLIGDAGSIRGDLRTDAITVFDQAGDADFAGDISGTGLIVKDGAGTLRLAGAGGQAVDMEVRTGVLVGDADSLVGDILNDASLVFDQTNDAVFSGALTGSGSTIKDGAGTLTLAGASSTDWSVQSGALGVGGASFSGDVAVDGGAAFGFATATDTTWDGILSGDGAFDKLGAAALTLTADSSSFTGATSVLDGRLMVDAVLGGDLTVSGGALGGGGAVLGAVSVGAGGLVGVEGQTLTLGSLALSDASTVDVTLGTPTSAALFDITRDLTLDGTLNVIDAGGFGAGVYGLFAYGGDLTDNGLAVGSTPSGTPADYLFVQTAVAGQVNLVNTTGVDLLFWDGGDTARYDDGAIDGGDGVWSADGRSWTGVDGAVNGAMRPMPGFAVFTGAAGTVSVDGGVNGDALAVTGMQFAVDGYRIEGDAVELAADEILIRVGDGTDTGADHTATIASELTGAGALIKTDLGTLVLTGANTYKGGTQVRDGTLMGDADSLTGDIVNDATLVFDQAGDGGFSGDLSGSGETVKVGAGTLTLTGASATDWSVRTGSLEVGEAAFGGDVAIDADGAFRFTTQTDTIWSGALTGDGAFDKRGAAILALTGDSSGFTGATSVQDGLLLVNGALGGDLSVGGSGQVGGSGRIESLAVTDGGMIAPGNSIGTLTIGGDFVMEAGAVYDVEVDPAGTASDLIAVAGTATLNGGVVQHIGLPGDYAPRSTYTILTAAGGVTGTFDGMDSDFAFLEALLGYTDQAVTMTLERNDISFDGVGRTVNQRAVGQAVEAGGFGTPLYGAVIGLNDSDARLAFDQLSGELHGSLRATLVEESSQIRSTIGQRLRPDGAAGERGVTPGVTVWSQAHGSTARLATDNANTEMRTEGGGLWLGAEATGANGVMLGVAAGSERATHRTRNAGEADREGYRLTAYGSGAWGALGLSGGVAASWDDLETARIAAFPGFAEALTADYQAETVQAFAETTWSIPTGRDVLEPFASLAHVYAQTDGFTEAGGDGALAVASETQSVTFATLGLGWRHDFTGDHSRSGDVGARLGWRHAAGDLTPATSQTFESGQAFTITGLPMEQDALVAEVGGEIAFGDALALNIDWAGHAGERSSAQRLSASLNWRF